MGASPIAGIMHSQCLGPGEVNGLGLCHSWRGIDGGVLAALLAKAGKRVIDLEKAAASSPWTRPEILWPATTETLFSLLPKTAWEADALRRLGGVDTWNGRKAIQLISAETLRKVRVERWGRRCRPHAGAAARGSGRLHS